MEAQNQVLLTQVRSALHALIVLLTFLIVVLQPLNQAEAEEFPPAVSSEKSLDDEFAKGFADGQGMQEKDHKAVEADRLKIGGNLQAELQATTLENTSQNDYISTPLTLEMYLDSQLKDDVRVFVRGRFIHNASVDETRPSPVTGQLQKQTVSHLDEIKLSLQTHRKIFWTLGKQKIKWGASKFWNPTDFLNSQKRDFLRTEDLRSGISMIKAHMPWQDNNFYLLAIYDRASDSSQIGSATRLEIPFSSGEWSFSAYSQKAQSNKFGTDVSFSVSDFDFYLEGARSDVGTDQNASGGVVYQFKYSDEDSIAIGLEGFWQENGTTDKSKYAGLLASSKWNPFYIGKVYSLLSIQLNAPGELNQSNFSFYMIQNQSDKSQYYRVSWMYSGMSDLLWTLALGARSGDAGSEMKYFGQGLDASVLLKSTF